MSFPRKEPGRPSKQSPQELRTVRETYAQYPPGHSAGEVEGNPVRPMCLVRFSTQPQTQEIETLGSYINEPVQVQNHRLSGWVVRRLFEREQSEEIGRFIKVVQMSDRPGLAHVLNDLLMRFICDLLKGPAR